ncbi:MAG: argininosuccinate lyase [Candidatus Methanomethylophilaceae archaeon]|nr:argininosuccinate lyase [Candidatus Methanomethylophilaceae archaeon]
MKMWAGRFTKEEDSLVNDFNSSISFDCRMYREDIEGSIAHATMLGTCNIIPKEEADAIVAGLRGILADLESGALSIDPEAEDIHMFVEEILTNRIGDAGKRLHTARSRNDQVALDLRMYCKREIREVQTLIRGLLGAIADQAEKNADAVMSGYTHLQRAQPVTFAHSILAYAQMLIRDLSRLDETFKRTDFMPLGSGALASTTYPIDRRMTAELLGFHEITLNSIDGVSDRDFAIEFCSDLSILMMHLSRFSEEIILWCSSEFRFLELDDAFSTGSSIMPQKKNPDIAELVRGKTGRVYGDLQTLLVVMKGLPLAYNKDMQEDKEALFDAIDTAKQALKVFTRMFETVTVRKDNLRSSASEGFINATDCADYLTKKGLPFRSAYRIVGQLVGYCIQQKKTLETLSLDEYRTFSDLFEEDIFGAINLENCVSSRKAEGGPSMQSVLKQIATVRELISGS